MLNLLPRDDKYFDRFSEMAQRIHESARILDGFFKGVAPASTVADQIKRLEHECDEISHQILREIDRTFITPIDREDIHELARSLDEETSQPFYRAAIEASGVPIFGWASWLDAGTSQGLFKSTDGGASWTELPLPPGFVHF